MASLESYAQQANTVLLDGLAYNLSPSAPYIIDRRSSHFCDCGDIIE
jgi:hypothetical protein